MKVGRRPSPGPGASCRSCRAPLVWALTETGRKMPVDLQPVGSVGVLIAEARDGNLVLCFEVDDLDRPRGPQLVLPATEEQRRDWKVPLWKSHFATCPKAAQHRRPRS